MAKRRPAQTSQDTPLDPKLAPTQARARATFETVLATAGALLAEVGFERLSTNMVCQRAGLTPPALYRYFPNKYAILSELGRRLMDAQDEAVFAWIAEGGLEARTLEEAVAKNLAVQTRVNQITREAPGGVWILRAMRAVPLLHEIRVNSRDRVARHLAVHMQSLYPGASVEELMAATRLSTELMYAATEMALEEPSTEEARINEEVCRMISLYYAHFDARRFKA
ncbi:helix-turn-helix domain containing protein [Caulobacter segnis]|uniref:TetR/AcrR family transcriptional regulator n=1 Tax=Caulobacter segnis TaxID=88688 RepID=UPI00240F8F2E|nr:TetR/AcrR family transcriptional regulator [Caulobacter segnis]MDG2520322.1 helix-turn-helix domain containing protein [Caulobacter segnis]